MGERNAARLEGDRYQHLYSWHLILDLFDTDKRIDHVWIEHPHAAAADDVTVHPQHPSEQATRYYQIKWHVDHRSGYSMTSLIDRGTSATSLLEKLWKSWNTLCGTEEIEIWLVSNWAPHSGDPLGFLIQGRDYRLKDQFLTASPRSELGRLRRQWQDHLEAADESFAAFYRSLRFRLGFTSIADLEEVVDRQMQAHGLRSGDGPRGAAIDQVRVWIEEGGTKKTVTLATLKEALDRLDLWATADEEESIAIVLHTWAVRKYDCQFDYELDWSAYFDHQSRQVPDPATWNEVFLPELRKLEQTIGQTTTCRRLRLRGSLCLSAAFALGHTFSVAGGYRLEIQHRTQLWHSETPPDPNCQLETVEEPDTSAASDLLVVLSITGDARPRVWEYVQAQGLAFRAHLYLSPAGGAHDYSVQGAAHASALARLARLKLRQALGVHKPTTTHLFYFGPQSLAILIGQKLNACGPIQLYEYQNLGYVPSCLLR